MIKSPSCPLRALLLTLCLMPLGNFFAAPVNVKDFGAVGDGVADDTLPIQKAVNHARELGLKTTISDLGKSAGLHGHKEEARPEVVFPAGRYRITQPVVFQRYALVRGMDGATVVQDHADKDIFYFHGLWRATVENMSFEGGGTQIRVWTANMGSAQIFIDGCTFKNSSDYAVECTSLTAKRVQGEDWHLTKPLAPYKLRWTKEGLAELEKIDREGVGTWANSTLFVVQNSVFDHCMRVSDVSCDTTVFKNCEVVTSPEMEGAAFYVTNTTHVLGMKGRMTGSSDAGQSWFHTARGNTRLAIRDGRFTSSGDSGMPLVRSFMMPRRDGTSILIENCETQAAGSPSNAIISIAENTHPEIISISRTKQPGDAAVKAVAWDAEPTRALLESIKGYPQLPTQRQFHFQFFDNSPNIDISLPQALKSFVSSPIPEEAREQVRVAHIPLDFGDFIFRAGKTFYAAEHGIQPGTDADRTEAMRALFELAGKEEHPLVIFPEGIFRLSESIPLPSNVTIKGEGRAIFVQTAKDANIFECRNAERVAVRNCAFVDGKNAIDLRTDPAQKAEILVENCYFDGTDGYGISCFSGDIPGAAENRTSLLVSGANFRCMRAVATNAQHSEVASFWGTNFPRLDDDAFIASHGNMRIQSALLNPTAWQLPARYRNELVPENWEYSRNIRWVDNWGKLYSVDNRFGGECRGITNVYNRSRDGRIYVGGGITRFFNNGVQRCIVYLEECPKVAILENITAVPVSEEGSARWLPEGSPCLDGNRSLFVESVMTPDSPPTPKKKAMRILNILEIPSGREKEFLPAIIELQRNLGSEDFTFLLTLDPQQPPYLKKLAVALEGFRWLREQLHAQGFRSGILVQAMIGHGERGQLRSPAPFQRIVRMDGSVVDASFCPLDKGFQQHVANGMTMIAEARPDFVLTDDDFRLARDGTKSCFCPLHLELFHELSGMALTREELAAKVALPTAEGEKVRLLWHRTEGESLMRLARVIRAALDKVNPDLRAGICANYTTLHFNDQVSRIMAGRQRPLVRLAGGFYSEGSAKVFPVIIDRHLRQRRFLPDDVEVLQEADTYPHHRFSVSATTQNAYVITGSLLGLDGTKTWVQPRIADDNRAFVEAWRVMRPTLDAIGEFAKKIHWRGAGLPVKDDELFRPPWDAAKGKQLLHPGWVDVFGRMGFPHVPGGEERSLRCFDGAAVEGWSVEEWKGFLARGVLLDGDAAERLCRMGLGEYIGVKAENDPGLYVSGERYSDDSRWNGRYAGDIRSASHPNRGDIRRLTPLSEEVIILGQYIAQPWRESPTYTPLSPSVTLYRNTLGGRVAVYAGCLQKLLNGHFILPARREQLGRVLRWLAAGEFPVQVQADHDLYVLTGELPDREGLLLYLVNLQADPMPEVLLGEVPDSLKSVEYLNANGNWEQVLWRKTDQGWHLEKEIPYLTPTLLRLNRDNDYVKNDGTEGKE